MGSREYVFVPIHSLLYRYPFSLNNMCFLSIFDFVFLSLSTYLYIYPFSLKNMCFSLSIYSLSPESMCFLSLHDFVYIHSLLGICVEKVYVYVETLSTNVKHCVHTVLLSAIYCYKEREGRVALSNDCSKH